MKLCYVHGMKVAERVLERRLRQTVEIDKMQFVFRPVQEQVMQYSLQDSYKRDIEENTGNCGRHL